MKITPNIDKKRAEAAEQIRNRYAKVMEQIVKPYSDTEQKTWFSQLKEADEWLHDASTPTPMLSALAANRGITINELVAKVKHNDQRYRAAVGAILGKQQRELDELYNG